MLKAIVVISYDLSDGLSDDDIEECRSALESQFDMEIKSAMQNNDGTLRDVNYTLEIVNE